MTALTVSLMLFYSFLCTVDAVRSSLAAWTATPSRAAIARCSGRFRLSTSRADAFASRKHDVTTAVGARRRTAIPLCSTASKEHDADGLSLFIFGVGYVATALALTFLRKGWTVHGTCTDPRKVKSLGDQGIKVGWWRGG